MNGRIMVKWKHSGAWPTERWEAIIKPVRPYVPDPNDPFAGMVLIIPLWAMPLGSWEALPHLVRESQWKMLWANLRTWYRAVFVDLLLPEGDAVAVSFR